MIISLTVNENELCTYNMTGDIKLAILDYLKNKIDKGLLIEIYSVEKKNGNYLVIASIEKDFGNKPNYH